MLANVTASRFVRQGRLVLTALSLLLAQGWVLALPLLHAAVEAPGPGGGHAQVVAFVAACPLDCQDPGHEHRGHDSAACASCHASRLLGAATQAIRLAGQTHATSLVAALDVITPERSNDAPPRLRGPPAPSLLS